MSFSVCDLCDILNLSPTSPSIIPPNFLPISLGLPSQSLGFSGQLHTIRPVVNCNHLVKLTLSAPPPSPNKILVIDHSLSPFSCSMLGGNLASLALVNGWKAVVVNGCVRDVGEINAAELPVLARGVCPVRSNRPSKSQGAQGAKGEAYGETGVDVDFGGTVLKAGGFLYHDGDGSLFSPTDISHLGQSPPPPKSCKKHVGCAIHPKHFSKPSYALCIKKHFTSVVIEHHMKVSERAKNFVRKFRAVRNYCFVFVYGYGYGYSFFHISTTELTFICSLAAVILL